MLIAMSWTGKHHIEKTKQKIGLANVENHIGSKNSQFGTMWITNGIINKKIKVKEFQLFEKEGWRKGRICSKMLP
jgi:hypothetical protein